MDAQALVREGLAKHRAGDLATAEALYRRALAADSRCADAYHFLGTLARQVGQDEAAVDLLSRALALKPGSVRTINNLGEAYRGLDRAQEAERCFRQAIALWPDYAEAHQNLGVMLAQKMDLPGALAEYGRAIALQPENAEAHVNRALVLLQQGRFEEGWTEFEWRRKMPPHRREMASPQWNGERLDETLFIFAEQGFGDTIQFSRYLPLVAERCRRVVVECQWELVRLMRESFPMVEVITQGEAVPSHAAHSPLMSLARVFGVIPNEGPYLMAPAWAGGLDGAKKIGLAWATSALSPTARRRSATLADVAAFARRVFGEDAALYSLQKGPAAFEATAGIVDCTPELNDFADTAALVSRLDAVVTVDTVIAHVAGALGRPVHVLLPFASDWRWLLGRADSPWYPTAVLHRQRIAGEWASIS